MAEGDDEYEEVLVYAEFSGLVESGEMFWKNAPDHVDLLGLDTEAPVVQIGEVTFRGSYEDSVGSLMFFDGHETEGSAAYGMPPLLTSAMARAAAAAAAADKTAYKHACHTDKVLRMKRIFMQPKGATAGAQDGGAVEVPSAADQSSQTPSQQVSLEEVDVAIDTPSQVQAIAASPIVATAGAAEIEAAELSESEVTPGQVEAMIRSDASSAAVETVAAALGSSSQVEMTAGAGVFATPTTATALEGP